MNDIPALEAELPQLEADVGDDVGTVAVNPDAGKIQRTEQVDLISRLTLHDRIFRCGQDLWGRCRIQVGIKGAEHVGMARERANRPW